MGVQVNYLAVLLAALSSMVIGSLWYMPSTFGEAWQKLSGVKLDRKNMKPGDMARIYGPVFLASLVTAIS